MNDKLTLLIFMFTAVFGVIANEAPSARKQRIVIMPFSVSGGEFDKTYVETAQDFFTTELINGNLFQVVEREQLEAIMKESDFQRGDNFDEASVVELGKLVGAQIVVIGTLKRLKNTIAINVRGINIETGVAEFAEKGTAKDEDELLNKMEEIAQSLLALGKSKQTISPQKMQLTEIPVIPEKPSNIDFTVQQVYTDVPLTNSEREFLKKYFQGKWEINEENLKRLSTIRSNYMVAGILMLTFGLDATIAGILMIALGFAFYGNATLSSNEDYDMYQEYYNKYSATNSEYLKKSYKNDYEYYYESYKTSEGRANGYLALGIVGIPVLIAGIILASSSAGPFSVSNKTDTILSKIKKFTADNSLSCDYSEKRVEIAFRHSF